MSYRKSLDSESTIDVVDPLLEKQFPYDSEDYKRPKRWTSYLPSRFAVLAHISLLACYLLVFIFALSRLRTQDHGPDHTYSPAQSAVTWERQWLDYEVNTESKYKGNTTAVDDAWQDLFEFNNIRVTEEELSRMNRTSVQLNDGSGEYLAALDVFHHLHCLKLVRNFIHGKEMPFSVGVSRADHLDHCLDAVRQTLMCRAEVTFLTYSWRPDISFPWATLSYPHTCVNWESILGWAKARHVNIFQDNILVNPLQQANS